MKIERNEAVDGLLKINNNQVVIIYSNKNIVVDASYRYFKNFDIGKEYIAIIKIGYTDKFEEIKINIKEFEEIKKLIAA